jgi:uncharacterized protein YdeI (YjbR/CyaY-like superfamily)
MIKTESFEKVEVSSQGELRAWLIKNHSQSESVWLVSYKKNQPEKYVSTDEVLDELLCFGWIDGIRRKLDDRRTMQLISPRRAEHWARTYKERAIRLIDEKKMQESGMKVIESSKLSGLWNFMDDVDKLIIPDDLSDELSKLDGAADFFNSINASSKRFVLRWVKLAKTEKTRLKRIRELAQLSAKGEKLSGS